MGLFDGKAKAAPVRNSEAAPVPELPPTLSDADLVTASGLMDRWDAALGNGTAMYACVSSIAKIGGFPGLNEFLTSTPDSTSSEDFYNRPWRWWAEAARLANARGEHVLAGRIFLFAYLFVNQILPTMSQGDQIHSGLTGPKQGTYESIAASAVDSLAQLPQHHLIHHTATGKVDVAGALGLARSVG